MIKWYSQLNNPDADTLLNDKVVLTSADTQDAVSLPESTSASKRSILVILVRKIAHYNVTIPSDSATRYAI